LQINIGRSDDPPRALDVFTIEVASDTLGPRWLQWIVSILRLAASTMSEGAVHPYSKSSIIIREKSSARVVRSLAWGRDYEGAVNAVAAMTNEAAGLTAEQFRKKWVL